MVPLAPKVSVTVADAELPMAIEPKFVCAERTAPPQSKPTNRTKLNRKPVLSDDESNLTKVQNARASFFMGDGSPIVNPRRPAWPEN
jgi:hypothetical protein